MNREWISKINQLNELELGLQINGTEISIEWFRAMYGVRPPNRSWHYHRGTEIHYLMEGAVQVIFDGETVLVKEGEAVIIPGGVRHRLSETEDRQPFYKVVVNYSVSETGKSGEAALLKRRLTPERHMLVPVSNSISTLLKMSVEESICKKKGFLTVIQGNLLSALMLTARQMRGEDEAEYNIPKKKNVFLDRMEKIESFVTGRLDRRISVEEIAKYMNLSAKQVGRTIFHCRGKNTREYLMGMRVEKAKELLKNPEYSIAEVSEVLGFCNEYYFSRFFRQMEGMPPGKYRRSISA